VAANITITRADGTVVRVLPKRRNKQVHKIQRPPTRGMNATAFPIKAIFQDSETFTQRNGTFVVPDSTGLTSDGSAYAPNTTSPGYDKGYHYA
jgi:hypothetical protein